MPIATTSMPTSNILTLHSRLSIAVPPAPATMGAVSHSLHESHGKRHVLKNPDLHILPGEFVAIVGREGSGKSDLLRRLAGADALFDGPDGQHYRKARAGDPAREDAGEQTRILLADAGLLPWRQVLANVAVSPAFSAREEAVAALRRVGLGEYWGAWPSALSDGQKQRVSLARALLRRPGSLFLDEPFSELDTATRRDLQQRIEGLWRGDQFTVVLATRDVDEAVMLADRILVVDDGRIVLDQRVALARPRQRATTSFAALETRVRNAMQGQGTALPATDRTLAPVIPIGHLQLAA